MDYDTGTKLDRIIWQLQQIDEKLEYIQGQIDRINLTTELENEPEETDEETEENEDGDTNPFEKQETKKKIVTKKKED